MNAKATITLMRGDCNERYSLFEIEPGVWSVSVERWNDNDAGGYSHQVLWAQMFPSLLEALAGLRETGFLYDSAEVVEAAELLTGAVKKGKP